VRRLRLFRPRELALTFLAFAAIPFALYVLSYVPWLGRNYGAISHPLELGDLWTLQKEIWRYHANLDATHPYFSKWYTWPWLWRPTWYYFQTIGDRIYGIVAVGNPALWWASVPITLWALISGAWNRDPRRLFSGLGFVCLYLPWGISPRTLNYSHYLFEAIPYACLSLGLLLDRFWDHPVFKQWTRSYLAVVVALFFFFLPFLVALPVPPAWYYARIGSVGPWTWFASWI
jgi:dolichyl-phosphate-mannose-protein mannosyltransferase